jgi:hypothetical protein
MAFVFTVENGTGVVGANAYALVTFVDDYFAGIGGDTVWTTSGGPQKQQAIVAATRYIEQRFSRYWIGTRGTEAQGLSWPRIGAFVDGFERNEEVPVEVKNATAEYAVRARVDPLVSDTPATQGDVVEESVTVGPVSQSKRYAEGGSPPSTSGLVPGDKIQSYPAADMWLEPLLRLSGRSYR